MMVALVGCDIVDGGPSLFLLVSSEPQKVLLSVGGDLSGSPGHDKLPRNAPPASLSKLGEPSKEKTVLLLGPGDSLLALVVRVGSGLCLLLRARA